MMVWKNLAWLYRSHCHRYFSLIKLVTPLPGRQIRMVLWQCGHQMFMCSIGPRRGFALHSVCSTRGGTVPRSTEQWSKGQGHSRLKLYFSEVFLLSLFILFRISWVQCLISLGSKRTLAAGTLIWVWFDWIYWILFRFLLLGKGYVESEPIKEQQLYRLLRPLPLFFGSIAKHIAISSDFGKLRLLWLNSAGWKMKKAATVCIQDLWHRKCLTTRR